VDIVLPNGGVAMEPEMVGAILNMNKTDLDNALKSLSKHDYETIQALTLEMEESIKNKSAHKKKVMFGYWSALELLAKLGIFLGENGVVK